MKPLAASSIVAVLARESGAPGAWAGACAEDPQR